MFEINDDRDFNELEKRQREEVQKKLDHYTGNLLNPNEKHLLFRRVEKRGKALRNYFRKCNYKIL